MMHLIDNYYIDTTGYGVTLQTATGKDKNGWNDSRNKRRGE